MSCSAGTASRTLPSRLDARDLGRLAAAGAQAAGPPPLPPASGDVTEVGRTVNAPGNVSPGDHIISAGLQLTGQRVTRRVCVRGAVMAGGQRIQAGLARARKTVAVTVGPGTIQVAAEPGITVTAARAASRDIRRHKAPGYG